VSPATAPAALAAARPDPLFAGNRGFRRFFVAGWALLALVTAAQRLTLARLDGVPLAPGRALAVGLAFATGIAGLALSALATADRLPFRADRWLGPLLLTALAGVVVSSGFAALETAVRLALGDPGHVPAPVAWVVLFPGRAVLFFNMVAVGHALRFFRAAQEREVAAARLEARLAESRLELMKLRIQPRLLFGMLDVLAGLVRADTAAADRALARLSDFLRATLYRDEWSDATLAEEAELLTLYLAVVAGRGGRPPALVVEVDPAAAGAHVPHLLLEAVADALLAPGPGALDGEPPGLSLRARVADGRLRIDARGTLPPEACSAEALAALSERLSAQYGGAHRLYLGPAPGGGARLALEVPLRAAEEEEADDELGGPLVAAGS
jgi:hypothetical protein